jgi:hypothetical protein
VGDDIESELKISWQEHDLNQLAASKLKLPRKRPGTGRTETKKYWESTTGLKQRTYTRALCQKNGGSVEI